MRKICFLLMVCFLYGCSAMPYKSKFACPQAESGICGEVEKVYQMALYKKGNVNEDVSNINDKSIEKLFNVLKKCIKEDNRSCVKETKEKLLNIYSNAVDLGEKRAMLSIKGKVEERRLQELDLPREEKIQVNPIIMEIVFAPYKTREGLLVGEHVVYKVVSYGDWLIDAEFEREQGERLGGLY